MKEMRSPLYLSFWQEGITRIAPDIRSYPRTGPRYLLDPAHAGFQARFLGNFW